MVKWKHCYLSSIPKDLIRIIYKYLYDYVPKQIIHDVHRCNVSRHKFQSHGTLKSPTCKMHNKCFISDTPLMWKRYFISNTYVCENLIKSQDFSGNWNKNFKDSHRISIINGTVYHIKSSKSHNSNKYILVPFFESDHCWQDLAMRFMRNNETSIIETNEMKQCETKFVSHVKREKKLTSASNDATCIIC